MNVVRLWVFATKNKFWRGVGRTLVGTVLEWALAAGCVEATVPTQRARDFYIKLGFEETAVYLKRRP